MTASLWIAALAAISFAVWLLAAFILRLPHAGRLALTLSIPALVAGGFVWSDYWAGRSPLSTPGWDAVFLVISLGAGAIAALLMLPIWFFAEEKLGWRVR